jgi:rare lipoprotein A
MLRVSRITTTVGYMPRLPTRAITTARQEWWSGGGADLAVTGIGKQGRSAAVRIAAAALACALAAACSSTPSGRSNMGGLYHVGKPYTVAGKTYYPREDPNYRAVGVASWYGSAFQGRRTANGEVFDMHALSAAHPTLPLPSYVRVTNLTNHRSVVVRVNDRGPFAHGRVIDVSKRTAEMLGFVRIGRAKVRVEYVGRADLEGRDERHLLASYRGPGGALESRSDDVQVAFASQPPDRASDEARLAELAALAAGPGGESESPN